MQLDVAVKNNVTVITFCGELDFNSSQEVSERLMELVEENDKIVIDMKCCTYVSSSGLRAMLLLGKRMKQRGNVAVLANLTEEVADIMEMTGFGTIFRQFSDLDSAVAYVNQMENYLPDSSEDAQTSSKVVTSYASSATILPVSTDENTSVAGK